MSLRLSPGWVRVSLVVLIVCPALVYALALIFGKGYVLGWQRADSVQLPTLLPLAMAFLIYLGLIELIQYALGTTTHLLNHKRRVLLWGALLMASVALQIAATAVVEPYPMRGILNRQFSQFSSGYFTVGARLGSVYDTLNNYVTLSQTWPIHPRNHPPGLILLFWFTTRITEGLDGLVGFSQALAPYFRPLACFDEYPSPLSDAQVMSGVLGATIEFAIATLTALPLFAWVRRLFTERAAWLAAALYPITACMLQWVSRWDRAFPLLTLTGLWLIENIIQQRRTAFASTFALGLLVASLLFINYAIAPMLLAFGLYALMRIWLLRQHLPVRQMRQWLLSLPIALLAFAVFWAFWMMGFSFDAIGHFRSAMSFHVTLDRPYWPWALFSVLDVFNHIGLPLIGVALVFGWRSNRALWLAFFGTLVTLGITRLAHDETGRLLMFMAPLALALAASTLSQIRPLLRVGLIALTLLQVFLHIGLLRVISYGTDPISVPTPTLPTTLIPTQIRYGAAGELELLGYTVSDNLAAGRAANLTLYWKLDSAQPLAKSYKIFLHVADSLEDETRIVNHDGKPMNWALPTTCWLPGQIVRDEHTFVVDANAKPGDWLPLLGLYEESSGQRMHVHTAQHAKNGAVQLPTPFRIK